MDEPQQLLTLQQLSIKLGINYQTALALKNAGQLPHDFETGHAFLYKPERVNEFKKTLENYGVRRAIAENQKRQAKK